MELTIDKKTLADVINDIVRNEVRPMEPVVRVDVITGKWTIETGLWDEDDDQVPISMAGMIEFLSDFDLTKAIEAYIEDQGDAFTLIVEQAMELKKEMAQEEDEPWRA